MRSTVWALAGSAVVIAGTGLLLSTLTRGHLAAGGHQQSHVDAVRISLFGMYLAQLAIGVLGVLVVTGEYATGMIRATLAAAPRRLAVLGAKLGVYAVVALVTCETALFATFVVGQILKNFGVSRAAPGAAGPLAGTLLSGLLGMAGLRDPEPARRGGGRGHRRAGGPGRRLGGPPCPTCRAIGQAIMASCPPPTAWPRGPAALFAGYTADRGGGGPAGPASA